VKSRRPAIFLGGLALLAGGAVLHSLKSRPGARVTEADLPAVVGGYRTLAADCFWLQTNLAWENGDAAKVRGLIDFTVTADPQAPYFWLNGARILAYDLPAWQRALDPQAPGAVQQRCRATAANEALVLLERGLKWHGRSAALHLEMANICLYALGDRQRAAEYYRRASEQADAPDYAVRICARLEAEEKAGMTLTR
jgi:tetratricopeptide (TPR) repeat protein